jgi:hypothetical protein
MPDLDATCSLDLGCPADDFAPSATPTRTAGGGLCQHQRGGEGARRLDGDQLLRAGHRAPPEGPGAEDPLGARPHLGRYIQEQTGADMLLWNGACIVHDEFKGLELAAAARAAPRRRQGAGAPGIPAAWSSRPTWWAPPRAAESAVVEGRAASATSSPPTTASCTACASWRPTRLLIEAPTAGNGATCKSCAHCPWMAMNGLRAWWPAWSGAARSRSTENPVQPAAPRLHRAHAGLRGNAPGQLRAGGAVLGSSARPEANSNRQAQNFESGPQRPCLATRERHDFDFSSSTTTTSARCSTPSWIRRPTTRTSPRQRPAVPTWPAWR